ncbi:MAG: glycosyltransferase family protein [Nitrospina sp.]|jgi:spore coat polysaccharide biosynthesis protein SpsF (cytidylyltransferase family)|nr:glycosyltransferase family protein [Nitrospina sp.]MBT6716705.1 glycosyltransferase family protein [Nitrospina sp.]
MVAAIIQARMGSTRFPGKSARLLSGLSILEHIINRLQQVSEIDLIQLATTQAKSESSLIEIAKSRKVAVFQGSEEDVLERFIQAGESIGAQHIIRVCGDNPLIDIPLLRSLITAHIESNADYTLPADSIPLGVGCEVVRLETLKNIGIHACDTKYREHVTTWFHDHSDKFTITRVEVPSYLKKCDFRLTVDTPEDFALMEKIFSHFNLSSSSSSIDLEAVIKFLKSHPEIASLNSNIEQKDWRTKNQ